MSKEIKSSNRLYFIDALRGLAALYVLVYHILLIPEYELAIPEIIRPIIMYGSTGVTLFFVISAFTLCYTLHGKENDKNATLYFYIRRVFRIVPLYYVWFFGTYAFEWGKGVFAYLWSQKFTIMIYSFFLFNFIPGKQDGIVWASWTIGVEMVFYIIFPFLFKWCNSLRKSFILFIISVIIARIHIIVLGSIPGYNTYFGILSQLPVFAVGMMCFFIYDRIKDQNIHKKYGTLLIGIAAFGFVALPYININLKLFPAFYIMALVYGCLLIGLYIFPIKLIVNKLTLFSGLISYSLYLNQSRFVYWMGDYYEHVYSIGYNHLFSYLICIVITIIPLSVISYLTYRIIEKPGIDLGRLLIKKIKVKSDLAELKTNLSS